MSGWKVYSDELHEEVVMQLEVPGPGPEWVDTGILDQHGDPIVRPGREPIGYLSDLLG
jgi:hypothetical protein